MSTEYTLYSNGPVELFACERSGQLEIGVNREDLDSYLDIGIGLTTEEVLEVAIKLVECASYISEEPETVVAQLLKLIGSNQYLRSMPLT